VARPQGPEPLGARHARIADLRRLVERRAHRRATGRFVVDGPLLIAEALTTGLVEEVFVDAGAPERSERLNGLVADAHGHHVRVSTVAPGVLQRVADPVTPQWAVAVVRQPSPATPDAALNHGGGVFVCDRLADPGNLGTLLRVAEAAGLAGVWCVGDSTDPFGPKAVRASAGSVLRVPVAVVDDGAVAVRALAACGHAVVGLGAGGTPYDTAVLRPPVAVVVGSESHGVSDPIAAEIDEWVGIPMLGAVESLNAGVAGAVVAMEVARRRRTGSGPTGGAR